jgi:hypothetical protein
MKVKNNMNYWRTLPRRSFLKLLIAIFFIFSINGFVNDIFNGYRLASWKLFSDVILFGLFAMLWVYCIALHKYFILATATVVQVGYYILSFKYALGVSAAASFSQRILVDGSGIMLMLLIGFFFLINFILSEGLQHIRIRTEIDLAREMHHILVPPVQFENDRLKIYGKSIPTEAIGGDLLDLYTNGSETICYLADVSGHGVKAGLTMGMFKTAMHMNFNTKRSSAQLIQETNKALYHLTEKSMFLTCACIRFYDNYHAEFSIAGHLPILHYQRANRSFEQLLTKQIPVSVKPDYTFVAQEITYEAGDIFMLLSDGLIETRSKQQEEFGFRRLENIFLTHVDLPLADLFNKIITAVNDFGKQHDDQTLMLIHCL